MCPFLLSSDVDLFADVRQSEKERSAADMEKLRAYEIDRMK